MFKPLFLSALILPLFLTSCGNGKIQNQTPFVPMSLEGESKDLDERGKLLKTEKIQKKHFFVQKSYENYLETLQNLRRSGNPLSQNDRLHLQEILNEYKTFSRAYSRSIKVLGDFEYQRFLTCMGGMKSTIEMVKKVESLSEKRVNSLEVSQWTNQYPELKKMVIVPCPDMGKLSLLKNGGRRFLSCEKHGLYGQRRETRE